MRIMIAAGRFAEAPVELGDEAGRVSIGRFARADAAQTQLLDQPVLQGQIGALHTPFGLTGVGTERVDVELVQGSPELRHAFASRARAVLDVEHARLVAVKRRWLAVREQIL